MTCLSRTSNLANLSQGSSRLGDLVLLKTKNVNSKHSFMYRPWLPIVHWKLCVYRSSTPSFSPLLSLSQIRPLS